VWTRLELPSVQILVAVANIQVRHLKAEVEKGSSPTVFGRGSADPKAQTNVVGTAEREAG